MTLHVGDCLDVMCDMAVGTFDAVVTDPPYELGFMGRAWDRSGVAFCSETWAEVLRVLKPGGHLLAFGAPRNYHRLACAVEDAGFEVRDCLMWVFGTGFPKSLNVSRAIDLSLGAEPFVIAEGNTVRRIRPGADQNKDGSWEKLTDRTYTHKTTQAATSEAAQWEGWGTALKPAYEPIILARKPLDGTVAANILKHGTGALNIDGCRVGTTKNVPVSPSQTDSAIYGCGTGITTGQTDAHNPNVGRWPANVVHDGSQMVLDLFPETTSGARKSGEYQPLGMYANELRRRPDGMRRAMPALSGNSGSAARFFYCAKAGKYDRVGSKHPTVKPLALMRWLCRLVTPPGGLILDPFAGTGTTAEAAALEGFRVVLIEREAEHVPTIEHRIARTGHGCAAV